MFKNILIAILVALAVWSVSIFVIHWATTHVRLALIFAILGALIIVLILILSKKFELTSVNVPQLLFVAVGATAGILIGTIVIGPIAVTVSCAQQPAYATPDDIDAYTNDVIAWYPTNDNYTVAFKQSNRYGAGNGGRVSPIKSPSGGEEINVRVLKSGTMQQRIVDVPGGYYWYDIKCDNGNHVDPKVRVPPR